MPHNKIIIEHIVVKLQIVQLKTGLLFFIIRKNATKYDD